MEERSRDFIFHTLLAVWLVENNKTGFYLDMVWIKKNGKELNLSSEWVGIEKNANANKVYLYVLEFNNGGEKIAALHLNLDVHDDDRVENAAADDEVLIKLSLIESDINITTGTKQLINHKQSPITLSSTFNNDLLIFTDHNFGLHLHKTCSLTHESFSKDIGVLWERSWELEISCKHIEADMKIARRASVLNAKQFLVKLSLTTTNKTSTLMWI